MQDVWRIQLLGGLKACQGDRVVSRFRGEKARGLFAYLAYYLRSTHPREVLIELLWPESDLPSGRNCLSIELSSLRHFLEPPGCPRGRVIQADNFAVQLNSETITTDVQVFESSLKASGREITSPEQAKLLMEAVDLYQGPLLPGIYQDWILTERQRLHDLYVQALRQLVKVHVDTHDFPLALDYARRGVSVDPYHEELHQDLMKLYVVAGQPTMALRQYQDLERILRQETGRTPSRSSRQLLQKIEHLLTELPTSSLPVLPRPRPNPCLPPLLGTVTVLALEPVGQQGHTPASEEVEEDLGIFPEKSRAIIALHAGRLITAANGAAVLAFAGTEEAMACALSLYELEKNRAGNRASLPNLRLALHTGDLRPQEDIADAPVIRHVQRLLPSVHQGQLLCTEATASLILYRRDPDLKIHPLGRFRLSETGDPERLFAIHHAKYPALNLSAPRALPACQNNLPLQITRYFGREALQQQLRERLIAGGERLITLTGPGGVGKTRLALEITAQVVDAFQGAVWYVPLADLTPDQDLIVEVVKALQLKPSPRQSPLEALIEAVSAQKTLLLLDNFEQIVASHATVVGDLLARLPELQCLVTSRQKLNIYGERVHRVPPLDIPTYAKTPEMLSHWACARLFEDRVQAVRPDFLVTEENVAAVSEICTRLEGIPLALELAASRMQALSVNQLRDQLEAKLNILSTTRRDISHRHRTLQNTIEWSYRLLAPELQHFFARLSVFRGGCSLEAAEEVCDEPLALDFLAQLCDCSLLTTADDGKTLRFTMLETIRQYAEQQLNATEKNLLSDSHLYHYLTLAEKADPHLSGPEAQSWLTRLDQEQDNLRSALRHSFQLTNRAKAVKLTGALGRFWYQRGYHTEATQWIGKALESSEDIAPMLRARVIHHAGNIAYGQAEYRRASAFFEESLTLWNELQATDGIAKAFFSLALVAHAEGNFARARELFEQSLPLFRQVDDTRGASLALSNLALVAFREKNYATARDLHQQSLILFREAGDMRNLALALNNKANTLLRLGVPEEVPALLAESLEINLSLSNKRGLAHCFSLFRSLAVCQEEMERAAILIGAEETLRAEFHFPLSPLAILDYQEDVQQAVASLGEEKFAEAKAQGAAMTMEQAIAYARQ